MGKWYEGRGPWDVNRAKKRTFRSQFKYRNEYWDGGTGLSMFKNRADPADTGEGGRYVVPRQQRNEAWIGPNKREDPTPIVYTNKGRRRWGAKYRKGVREGGWHYKNRGSARMVPHFQGEHYK